MELSLAPCTRCRRHARVGAACPFCGAEVRARARTVVDRRLSAVLGLAAATGVVVSACSVYGAPTGPPPGPYQTLDVGLDADDAAADATDGG